MYSYSTLTDEEKENAISVAKELIPEKAELVLLSFTGGRAFGWGGNHHDIDIHGMFAYDDDWFFKCHSNNNGYDMTLQNVYSVEEPELRWGRWKQYYDKSNPIYTHEEFDFESDFMDKCKPKYIDHIFPHDLHLQFSRYDLQPTIRSALHTYKEMLIPLYYLETGEIESNVIDIINTHPSFRYEELSACGEKYKNRESNESIDHSKVRGELEEIYWRLAEELDMLDSSGIDRSEIFGPPMPSSDIPGANEK